MTYPYSRRSPAANPAHYMYTQYGGIQFLDEYRRDRTSLLEMLPDSGVAPELDPDILLPTLPGPVDTLNALSACAAAAVTAAGRSELVAFFRRKVEVARRLCKAYTSEGRAVPAEDAPVDAYVLAADLFAGEVLRNTGHAKLQWLNTLLKTNDVLSYRRNEIRDRAIGFTARRPVTIELQVVAQDAVELGICLDSWKLSVR